jgi:hypothetical protein
VPPLVFCYNLNTDWTAQDTFEDAPDMTPRPTSHADRSRSRSLIRRESGGSSRSLRAESPVPVPELPNTDGAADSEKNENNEQGVPETSEETVDGQYGKSPLLRGV